MLLDCLMLIVLTEKEQSDAQVTMQFCVISCGIMNVS